MRRLFISVVVLAMTATVHAQTERELLQQARREMERGQEAYLAERWPEAAQAFLAAYAARPFSAFLYNAGIAYEKGGDASLAIQHYTRYIEAEPDASDAAEVRDRIARLRAALNPTSPDGQTPDGQTPDGQTPDGQTPDGQTPDGQNPDQPGATLVAEPPRPMKSLLSVETVPENATITVRQGTNVIGTGSSPFAQTLDEGEYEVTVEHPDYRTVSRSMQVRPGKVYVAILELSQGEFLGYLRVVTDPPGAQVFIDNHDEGSVGETPFQNVIATGTHHVWIERPGFTTEERDIEIVLGGDVTQEVQLTRVDFGRLRVVGNLPGSVVLVDDVEVGQVPYEGDVPSGPHRVTVRHRDMKDWEETIDIQRGQLTPVRVRLRPAVTHGGAWATTVLGALFLGAGIALHVIAANNLSDLEADRDAGRLAGGDQRQSLGYGLAIGSLASFGVGTIMGLLSLYYFVRDPLPDSEGSILEPRDWTLRPIIDPVQRAGGLDMSVRF